MNITRKANRSIASFLLIVLIVAAFTLSYTPRVYATPSLNATAEINSPEGAYLRKGPSKKTNRLGLMKHRSKITIIREHYTHKSNANITTRWYYIKVGSKTGHVRADLVKNIRYTTREAWAKSNLNYRIGAGSSMKSKGTLKKGASIKVVLESRPYNSKKSWYRIKVGNKYYYVSGDWITFSKPSYAAKSSSSSSKQSLADTVKQSASSKKVSKGAVDWAIKIANDNTFHYGNGQHAHHNGCYFCDTQPASKRKYVVKWEKTYCCNPFVHAAYAHGGRDSVMLKRCREGRSYDWNSYKTSKRFKHIGHPDRSKLIPGDVLCWDGHVAMYVGNNKIVEAGGYGEDDGKYMSKKWNNSIAITPLDSRAYKLFTHVYRYIGAN